MFAPFRAVLTVFRPPGIDTFGNEPRRPHAGERAEEWYFPTDARLARWDAPNQAAVGERYDGGGGERGPSAVARAARHQKAEPTV